MKGQDNGRFVDIAGMTFGQWTAISYAGNSKWLCRCTCGKEAVVVGATLRNGTSTRCRSCARSENNRTTKIGNKNNVTHGKSKTRLYHIWCGMISRCRNPNDTGYDNYGGRGIHVCADWQSDFCAFEKWAIASGYTDELSIDRINVDGDYEPDNCRWATVDEQSNDKTTNRFLEFRGERKTLSQWAKVTGIPQRTIRGRIDNYGWPVELALTTPVRGGGCHMTSQGKGFGLLFEMGIQKPAAEKH